MPRVELPELHEGRDKSTQVFKLVNQIKRRFNLVGQLASPLIAASTLVMGIDGDYWHVTGTTTISYIASDVFGDGDPIELYFDDGLTLTHGAATPPDGTLALKLAGSVNAVMAPGSKMRLRGDSSLALWVEMWRGAP